VPLFTTLRGGIVLLRYLSTALLTPGAPSMPLEIDTLDLQWESAFGLTCARRSRIRWPGSPTRSEIVVTLDEGVERARRSRFLFEQAASRQGATGDVP